MGDDMTDTPGEGHEAWRRKVRRYVDAGNRGVEPCYVGREDLLRPNGSDGRKRKRQTTRQPHPGHQRRTRCGQVGLPARDRAAVEGLSGRRCENAEHSRSRRASDALTADSELAGRGRVMPWELMRERLKVLGTGKGRKPLILICDEAQTLDQEDKATKGMLRSLHRGDLDTDDPIPAVPIFAGLANTEEVMGDCGISRGTGGNFVPLGGLTEAQSREYALKILEHLDADGSQAEKARWANGPSSIATGGRCTLGTK